MIIVKDPIVNGKESTHKIEIKKIEKIESDGTYLVRGIENNLRTIMHISIDQDGNIYKIPHSSIDYLKLVLPHVKKVDVTNSLKSQIDGQIVYYINNKPNITHEEDNHIELQIREMLIDLRAYLSQRKKFDSETIDLILQFIKQENSIILLPNSAFKNELLNIMLYEFKDLLNYAKGNNESELRINNYNKKVNSLIKLLSMKGKFLDLSNIDELLISIEERLKELSSLDNSIDPRCWYLIELFIQNLIDVLLITNYDEFKKKISLFNKNNLLYKQIIYELDNYFIENNQGKK